MAPISTSHAFSVTQPPRHCSKQPQERVLHSSNIGPDLDSLRHRHGPFGAHVSDGVCEAMKEANVTARA